MTFLSFHEMASLLSESSPALTPIDAVIPFLSAYALVNAMLHRCGTSEYKAEVPLFQQCVQAPKGSMHNTSKEIRLGALTTTALQSHKNWCPSQTRCLQS